VELDKIPIGGYGEGDPDLMLFIQAPSDHQWYEADTYVYYLECIRLTPSAIANQ